jgi:hypothetical protein
VASLLSLTPRGCLSPRALFKSATNLKLSFFSQSVAYADSTLNMATDEPLSNIPEGFTVFKENTARILLPDKADAFLNPVQEFNRDLSVAVIRTWSEELAAEKEARFLATRKRKEEKEHAKQAKKVKLVNDGAGEP